MQDHQVGPGARATDIKDQIQVIIRPCSGAIFLSISQRSFSVSPCFIQGSRPDMELYPQMGETEAQIVHRQLKQLGRSTQADRCSLWNTFCTPFIPVWHRLRPASL
jgi:hypothetical protein